MQPNWIKNKGIIKAQHGNKLLDTWQKLYDSNFGKGLRDFLNGKDRDLSDEEYRTKYGYNKPVGSSGMLGFLVAPEWEGLEIPEVTAMHYGTKAKPVMQAIETERLTNVPQKVVKVKPIAKPKDPYSPAMKAAFKEKTGYDFDGIPEIMKQRELKSWQDYVARLRQGHKRQ